MVKGQLYKYLWYKRFVNILRFVPVNVNVTLIPCLINTYVLLMRPGCILYIDIQISKASKL